MTWMTREVRRKKPNKTSNRDQVSFFKKRGGYFFSWFFSKTKYLDVIFFLRWPHCLPQPYECAQFELWRIACWRHLEIFCSARFLFFLSRVYWCRSFRKVSLSWDHTLGVICWDFFFLFRVLFEFLDSNPISYALSFVCGKGEGNLNLPEIPGFELWNHNF